MNNESLDFHVEIFSSAQYMTAASSHRGQVRQHNEDAYLVLPELHLWAVADGMGGHEAGDVASQLLVSMLADSMPAPSLADAVDHVEDIVAMAHSKILEYARHKHAGGMVGTTLVVFMVNDEDTGIVLWAGDSRLYRLRDGQLECVTRDHSKHNEMVDRGLRQACDASKKQDSHIITRAVGVGQDIFLDCALVDINPGDAYLLCSDGLYGTLAEPALQSMLDRTSSVRSSVEEIMTAALNAGARDNVTLVLVNA